MKRTLIIVIVLIMVFTICLGTAMAKPDKPDKPKGKSAEAKIKQELRKDFKAAVALFLSQIKANKKIWAQAGGMDEFEGIKDELEDALDNAIKYALAGAITFTPEQLEAIKAEIAKIKAAKLSLRTDKRALQTEWKKYISAKKDYNKEAAIAALQNVINLQLKRIEARKSIFASMNNIIQIIKEALEAAASPSPEPSPSPSV